MGKKLLCVALALLLILTCSATAFADSWRAVFTASKQMQDNLNTREFNDMVGNMVPGDSQDFRVWIINENSQTTRWYMKNFVDKSLEEAGYDLTHGSAYSYVLTYQRYDANHYSILKQFENNEDAIKQYDGQNKSGDLQILYNSEEVGGEYRTANNEGLHEATTNLKDYFVLDTLNTRESGLVTLHVKFEGETEGNVYQNTFAQIAMRFAVELTNNSTDVNHRTAVKTGDENNLLPYYIGMVVSGLVFLYFALDAYTDKLYKKGKGAR
jgi:hypothetical protein